VKEMGAALARQRGVLTRLLQDAAVPPADAEPLLLDVLSEIEEQGAPVLDFELVRRVDAACAAYAARRKRPPAASLPRSILQKRRRKG
jgi:hypothetical protein